MRATNSYKVGSNGTARPTETTAGRDRQRVVRAQLLLKLSILCSIRGQHAWKNAGPFTYVMAALPLQRYNSS